MVTVNCGHIKFENIQAIIFDKDGTLENSQNYLLELGIRRACLIDDQIPGIGDSLLMAFGIQDDILNPTGLIAVGSRQENKIAAATYIAETGRSWFQSLEIVQSLFDEADKCVPKNPIDSNLFTGSLEIIKVLSEAGLKLGILSADSTYNVQTFVKFYELSDYVQLMLGSNGILSKPDPQLFIQACQYLKTAPASTLMIGDSEGDIAMAKQGGAAGTIGICWNNPQASHLEKADITILELNQIQLS